MELKEIFEKKIKIEAKVISIESLFNNPDRVRETDYQPPYQRNYVWDDEKATYFIESILLGTEIPPLVYFVSSGKTEIVDGRQRYQTILRFKNNEFKLKKAGLQKLENIGIAGKSFKDLEISSEYSPNLTELFWDTKLRIITFSFHSQEGITEEIEDKVKKEIFQRYNSGITPLKQTEIAKANYLEDDLNTFIKDKITKDAIIFRNVSSIFHFDKSNIELIMKSIRESLVLHNIPIKYYTVQKQRIISKFYDIIYNDVDAEMADKIYTGFITKVNLLLKIRDRFIAKKITYNRLASECFFWALSILEKEGVSINVINDKEIDTLVTYFEDYFKNNGNPFEATRSSFAKEIYHRYTIIADYFSLKYDVDFKIYLDTTDEFKNKNKDVKTDAPDSISFNDLRINKPEPSSNAIVDICRRMERQKFLIRPQYQREEVIDRKKSSAIIESILLGIKIPPIFVYKRKDGVSEVLDGQQRLLSILGFIQKQYLDVNNVMTSSNKDGFTLSLKSGILTDLNKKSFAMLTREDQKKIEDFDLWIIEINADNNPNFEPIDLFLRLNNKPYPIKNDTFEMWNSFVNRDIVETVKSLYANYKDWFYIRKNNSRMENENLYTSLAYFQYLWNNTPVDKTYEYDGIDIYKVGARINFRVRSKNEITKILQESDKKLRFLDALNDLESNFIRKLVILLSEENTEPSQLNQKMDELIASDNGKRTQQNLYALWFFLFDIPICSVSKNNKGIIINVKALFYSMMNVSSKDNFLGLVSKFKTYYYTSDKIETRTLIPLSSISDLHNGIQAGKMQGEDTVPALFFDGKSEDNKISSKSLTKTTILKSDKIRECHLLIKKDNFLDNRINVLYSDKKIVYTPNYMGLSVTRHNFLIKYIYSFLSSSYTHSLIDMKELSISKVKDIQIPVIPLAEQQLFSIVADYLINCEYNSSSYLLFRRLLDTMVYELCFKSDFAKAKIDIIKYTNEFVELSEDIDKKKEQIEYMYSAISNPNHTLSSNMLRVLSIDEVMKIDSLI